MIIVGFILSAVGVIAIEVTAQSLSHEPRNLSDIPLWVGLVSDMPNYLVFVGIIAAIVGFIIRKKRYRGGMEDIRK